MSERIIMGVSPLKSYIQDSKKGWSGSKRVRARNIKASKAERQQAANEIAQEEAASMVSAGTPDPMGPGES